jgi:DNA-binding beta-propeller fold protein YncE
MHKNAVHTDATDVTDAAVVEPDFATVGTVDLQRGAIADLAVSTDGSTVVATHYGSGSISVIDADTMATGSAIDIPVEPFLLTAAERRAYVAIGGHHHDSVAVIDTVSKQIIANYAVEGTVADVAVSPDGTRIFVGQTDRDRVGLVVINTFGRIKTIDLAQGADRTVDAVQVSPNGRLVYVGTSDATSGKLLVVDVVKGRVIRDIPVASPIRDVALSHDGSLAYVAIFDTHWGGSIDIIDTAINEITAKVGIGGAPMQMAVSPDGTRVYIADYEHVAVLSTETNSIVDTLTVTAEPSCVAVSPDSTRLYIANHEGTITVMSIASDATTAETELITVAVDTVREFRALETAGV